MNVISLPNEFLGTGEVSGFTFKLVGLSNAGHLYEVVSEDSTPHYEVFKRRLVPICIDFNNRIYSDVDFKETYPKAKDFGIWAWTFKTLRDALDKFGELNIRKEENG